MGLAAPALQTITAARMIDNEPAHLLRCQVEKVKTILATDRGPREHPDTQLMNQGSRLQGVGVTLPPEISGSQAAQLPVNSGNELPASFIVSSPPFGE